MYKRLDLSAMMGFFVVKKESVNMDYSFTSYTEILEDIQKRNSDWNDMCNDDRAIIKAFVMQVIMDFSDYAQKIEQWENYYGKVDNNLNLQ